MGKKYFGIIFLWLTLSASAQTTQKLQKAFQQFEADTQLKNAISSLYVVDAKTGQAVFSKNAQVGLAPASTQKIITAVTAFEVLGKDFRFWTRMGYTGSAVYFIGDGDPTFGSWRYSSATPDKILRLLTDSLRKAGVKKVPDNFFLQDVNIDEQTIPDGWIWQDIGNYYGAGSSAINWRENQYDLILKSAPAVHGAIEIVADNADSVIDHHFINQVSAAEKGTGDNSYIYLPVAGEGYRITGTIPRGEDQFKISGSVVNPTDYFINDFRKYLRKQGMLDYAGDEKYQAHYQPNDYTAIIAQYLSPSLDSIVYCFLQKSINLYGEALIKKIGEEKLNYGSTQAGTIAIQRFWREKGIDPNELNIGDGSGLSPQNRVTAHAQVEILKYAKKQTWFPYFYDALPVYNNMKMKSGTIKDVKAFCGYQKAKDGKEYIFSFLVNNYNGPSSDLVNKMYKVLDVLK